METNLYISFNEAKHMVKHEYLSTFANTYGNKDVNHLAEEVNEKYNASLKHNYLLITGFA